MQSLLTCLADPALPPQLREQALHALCLRESALLVRALRGEETAELSLPDGIPPIQLFFLDDSELLEEQRPALNAALRELKPHMALAFDENGIAICCHCPVEERQALLCACSELLQTFGCHGAASRAIRSGSLLRQLQLTRMALDVGRQIGATGPLSRFEDHASMVLFMVLQEQLPLSAYYADELLQVIQQDYENGTELSRSLYGYLSCFLDLKQAAEQTGVHRNTIAYHIRKIMSLLKIERMDGDTGFDILCTYRMLSMMDS